MERFCSLFSQIVSAIPRGQFQQLVGEHRSDRHARGFTSWEQLVAMLLCHLGRMHSLREIEYGLSSAEGRLSHIGVKRAARSTLAYANEHRPWELYQSLFYRVLELCRTSDRRHKYRFKNKLLSIDSTTIEVVSEMYDWALHNKTKGAIKLHTMLDHDDFLPVFVNVTDGQTSDITAGREMPFPSGAIVVMDRGYLDYPWFRKLTDEKIFFVTRFKKNCKYHVIEERKPPAGVERDTIVEVTHWRAAQAPLKLRRVEIIDDEGEPLTFFSNHLTLGATTIAQIYKDRWQIELFFKALKQNLKIKTFIGTSANAIQIQIWTALIAMVIMSYLKRRSACTWSLSNLFAMLRLHLFTYHDLWRWLAKPSSPPKPPDMQLSFA
jgi:hypothetical protein